MERKSSSLDIVIPIYNEGKTLKLFYDDLDSIISSLDLKSRIFFINDGSNDHTGEVLESLAAADPRVVAVELSRNFGHQAALTAGLDLVDAELVITMDGDGEHPPLLIPQMIDLYRSGYDIVNTQRIDEKELSVLKRTTSDGFYWFINRISNTPIVPRSSDFRLMSIQVVKSLRMMPEYHRFLRGMVAWAGFPSIIVPFLLPPRLGGESKYSWSKMFKLAMDAIFSFSLMPLQIGIGLGLFFFLLAFLEMVYVLGLWVSGGQEALAPGWSSLMFMILIVGGFLMILLGLIGLYVGYIFQEVKRRPNYFIRQIISDTLSDENSSEKGKNPSNFFPRDSDIDHVLW